MTPIVIGPYVVALLKAALPPEPIPHSAPRPAKRESSARPMTHTVNELVDGSQRKGA